MQAGGNRGDRRIHVAVIRAQLVVEHDRDDEHDHVGLARRGRGVGRGPQPAGPVGRRHELGQSGLGADVRAALVDRRDDRLLHVDGDDVPAVRCELGAQRQAHLAGADHRHGAGRAGFAHPRGDAGGLVVQARVRLQLDRTAEQVRPGCRGAGGDGHLASRRALR